jgi:diguanylate cyclase (GGDEF)-like protein
MHDPADRTTDPSQNHSLADCEALRQRLSARVERERRAREEAERLLECKSLELYQANLALSAAAADLERRVVERTRELSEERQRAVHMAELDALTGIPNRAAFARVLRETLADTQARSAGVAALLIDLDDFKLVNDSLGHAAGDALLIETARRLADAVRPGDMVARLGGDEFAVIAHAVPNRQAALTLAQRLLNTLCRPAQLEGRSIPCGCSIGVAEAGTDEGDDLLRDADMALYASKRAGGGCVTVFELGLRADVERRAALDTSVRDAVVNDLIQPWYQPVLCRSSGRFVGAEMLARWHLPGGEVRPPSAFLATVEALGLLDLMMENMLRRALPEAAQLLAQGRLEYLTINVSPTQFNQGWALNRLPGLLAETGFPPAALIIELTETALVHDIARTRGMLAALGEGGMRIAIDDFGVGYSNFSLLRQLPFDMLKLDRTLICDIEDDEHARALAECILELASRLRIKVVAEGVETQRQAELLAQAGCASMQGYWFARPQRELATWFAPAAPLPVVPWACAD